MGDGRGHPDRKTDAVYEAEDAEERVFSVTVRDNMMIAHSLRGEVFGPAQRLHGATYVVDATFRRAQLDADGIVVDIGRAAEALRAVLAELGYRNLDPARPSGGNTYDTQVIRCLVKHGWTVHEHPVTGEPSLAAALRGIPDG